MQAKDILLKILRDSGDWMTRRQLTQEYGAPISGYYLTLLDALEQDGLIESREVPRGPIIKRFEYRAKGV